MLLSVQNFDRTYSKSVIRGSYTFYHISRRGWKAANIKNKLRCSSLYSLLFEWSIHSKVRVTLQRSIKHFWQWKSQTTKIVIASLQFQKNGTLLLFETIFRYWKCLPSSTWTGNKDENGWKLLKKIWPTSIILQSLRLKKPPKVYYGYCSLMKFVWYFLHNSRGEFCVWVT